MEYEYGQDTADQSHLIMIKGVKAYVRNGTSDSFVVDEVIRGLLTAS